MIGKCKKLRYKDAQTKREALADHLSAGVTQNDKGEYIQRCMRCGRIEVMGDQYLPKFQQELIDTILIPLHGIRPEFLDHTIAQIFSILTQIVSAQKQGKIVIGENEDALIRAKGEILIGIWQLSTTVQKLRAGMIEFAEETGQDQSALTKEMYRNILSLAQEINEHTNNRERKA